MRHMRPWRDKTHRMVQIIGMTERGNRDNWRVEFMTEQQQCIVIELLQNDDVKVQMFTANQLLHFGIVEGMLGADQSGTIEQ